MKGSYKPFFSAAYLFYINTFFLFLMCSDSEEIMRKKFYFYEKNVLQVASGETHTCFVKADNSLWCFGIGIHGQIGDGTCEYRPSPVKIMDDVDSISLGAHHTCAIKKDKSLWCWGDGFGFYKSVQESQRCPPLTKMKPSHGFSAGTGSSVPIKITDSVLTVSAGGYHTCIIKVDGSLWCFGSSGHGEVSGIRGVAETPLKVTDDVTYVSAGYYYTCMIKKDNSLWCWGDNYRGQVGDGTMQERLTPVRVMENVIFVSAYNARTCAIKVDNSLRCWGGGPEVKEFFRDGSFNEEITGVKLVFLGWYRGCIIKIDDTLWCWGRNDEGRLGDGTKIDREFPVLIDYNVKLVSLGSDTCVLKKDGYLKCWR